MAEVNPPAIDPKLVDRIKGILLKPRFEWPIIAAENTSVQVLFTRYAMVLAAIPALSTLMHELGDGPIDAVIGAGMAYGLALLSVYVLGIVIDGLAHNFGSEKNTRQSMKLAVYSMTPAWLAGILNIIGAEELAALICLYGIYLLYLGLAPLKHTPDDKKVVYTVVIVLVAVLLNLVICGLVAAVLGALAIVGAGAAIFALS